MPNKMKKQHGKKYIEQKDKNAEKIMSEKDKITRGEEKHEEKVCGNCKQPYRGASYCPHTDSIEEDWEKEFDRRYSMNERGIMVVGKDVGFGGHAMFHSESIKSFISSLLTKERERVVEMIESMEVMGIGGDFGIGYERGYQKACSEIADEISKLNK